MFDVIKLTKNYSSCILLHPSVNFSTTVQFIAPNMKQLINLAYPNLLLGYKLFLS